NTTTTEPPAFRELLTSVEDLSIDNGYGRLHREARPFVLAAYLEAPEGFADVVGEILAAADRPCGLLIYKLKQGHHVEAQELIEQLVRQEQEKEIPDLEATFAALNPHA